MKHEALQVASPEDERTEFLALLNTLEFPTNEAVAEMDDQQLHDLWRKNNEVIIHAIERLGLDSFPHLGTYGIYKPGLEKWHRQPDGKAFYVNVERPESYEEALAMLYALSMSGIGHARVNREMPQELRGGVVLANIGTDTEFLHQNFRQQSSISNRYLTGIRGYDSADEVQLLNVVDELGRADTRKMRAGELEPGTPGIIFNEVLLDELPDYYRPALQQATRLPDTRTEIANRLESIALIQKFLRGLDLFVD